MREFFMILLFIAICVTAIYVEYHLRKIKGENESIVKRIEDLMKKEEPAEILYDEEPIPEAVELTERSKSIFRNEDGKLSYKAAIENKRILEEAKREGMIKSWEDEIWK